MKRHVSNSATLLLPRPPYEFRDKFHLESVTQHSLQEVTRFVNSSWNISNWLQTLDTLAFPVFRLFTERALDETGGQMGKRQ